MKSVLIGVCAVLTCGPALAQGSSEFHCGHWAMLEYPDVFASESIKFLKEAA